MATKPPRLRRAGQQSEAQRKRAFDERRRARDPVPLYSTRRWRKRRQDHLAAHPLCVMCEAAGVVRAAAEVDHVVPIEQGGDIWSGDNLQALCKPHHSAKTAAETNAKRRAGRDPR